MADPQVESNSKEQPKTETDPIILEIKQKIKETFEIFDHEGNQTVDKREISAIVRGLGCFPTEVELSEILLEVEEDEPSDFIRFEKFEPVMQRVLVERRFRPQSEEQLLKAFQVLDQDLKNHLTRDELAKFLTEEGEPFSSEEIEEMMAAALDPQKGVVNYRDYIQILLGETT